MEMKVYEALYNSAYQMIPLVVYRLVFTAEIFV